MSKKVYDRICELCEAEFRRAEWATMTPEEREDKGRDYRKATRITRDRKRVVKGWFWAAAAGQLDQANQEIHAEVADDDNQYYSSGSRINKQRKIKNAIINRAMHMATASH